MTYIKPVYSNAATAACGALGEGPLKVRETLCIADARPVWEYLMPHWGSVGENPSTIVATPSTEMVNIPASWPTTDVR